MFKRENLDVNKLIYCNGIETCMVDCEGTEVWPQDSNGSEYLFKSQADKVMDAYEARIKELEQELEQANRLIAVLEASQPKWISVNDSLPPIKNEILVCHRDGKTTGAYYYAHYEKMSDCITHWMLFPHPPTTEKSTEDIKDSLITEQTNE